LGPSDPDVIDNLELIKDLELSRNFLAFQACKKINTSNVEVPSLVDHKDMDSSVHDDSDLNNDQDLLDVMVLRKGRKIKHRKKRLKKWLPQKVEVHLLENGRLNVLTSLLIRFKS
jgi:hypothetical protein